VFDCGEGLQRGQVVVGHIDVNQVSVLFNTMDGVKRLVCNVELEISMTSVIESLSKAAEPVSEDLLVDFWLPR